MIGTNQCGPYECCGMMIKGWLGLLGGVGDDTPDGRAGCDLFPGGEGADTSTFRGDFGTDIVADSGALGSLQVDGQMLAGAGQHMLKDVYQGEDSSYTYLKVYGGKLLVVLTRDGDGGILVKDWPAQGALGIRLTGDVAAMPGVMQGGDFKKKKNAIGVQNERNAPMS
ncbi:hypothetical protein FDZ73_18960 [bacterium]|nr:MAG: hypothetical protein FDZ73_18960 [bacterium]